MDSRGPDSGDGLRCHLFDKKDDSENRPCCHLFPGIESLGDRFLLTHSVVCNYMSGTGLPRHPRWRGERSRARCASNAVRARYQYGRDVAIRSFVMRKTGHWGQTHQNRPQCPQLYAGPCHSKKSEGFQPQFLIPHSSFLIPNSSFLIPHYLSPHS